jgi:hypothetical protein
MARLNENNIEKFIRDNKDKFGIYLPGANHQENFLIKLNNRIKHIISIVPYLLRVAIGTIIIFIASIVVWNSFIRKDRHDIKLKNKISLVINKTRPN